MALTKEEYALRLMPDFEVFDIIERELIKSNYLSYDKFLAYNSIYYMYCEKNTNQSVGIPVNCFRFALRSTRELKIDKTFVTTDKYTFIEVKNPSDNTLEYFYYVIVFDIDYIEKQQDIPPHIWVKYTSEDKLDTEILGVVI